MELPEIKKKLHRQIDLIDDEAFLLELNLLVASRSVKPQSVTFSKSQLVAIEEGRRQVAAGEVHSHEEVMEEAEEWLNEK